MQQPFRTQGTQNEICFGLLIMPAFKTYIQGLHRGYIGTIGYILGLQRDTKNGHTPSKLRNSVLPKCHTDNEAKFWQLWRHRGRDGLPSASGFRVEGRVESPVMWDCSKGSCTMHFCYNPISQFSSREAPK